VCLSFCRVFARPLCHSRCVCVVLCYTGSRCVGGGLSVASCGAGVGCGAGSAPCTAPPLRRYSRPLTSVYRFSSNLTASYPWCSVAVVFGTGLGVGGSVSWLCLVRLRRDYSRSSCGRSFRLGGPPPSPHPPSVERGCSLHLGTVLLCYTPRLGFPSRLLVVGSQAQVWLFAGWGPYVVGGEGLAFEYRTGFFATGLDLALSTFHVVTARTAMAALPVGPVSGVWVPASSASSAS